MKMKWFLVSMLVLTAQREVSGAFFTTQEILQMSKDLASANEAAVGIIGWKADGSAYFLGSGTVVEDNKTVITAAHIYDPVYTTITVRTGATITSALMDGQFEVTRAPIIHSSYTGVMGQGYDNMVLKVDGGIAGVTPAKLGSGQIQIGDEFTYTGHGGHGILGNHTVTHDFTRKAIIGVFDDSVPIFFERDKFFGYTWEAEGHPNFRMISGMLTTGYSGGGAGKWEEDTFYVDGVVHAGSTLSLHGTRALASRIDNAFVFSTLDSPPAAVPEASGFTLAVGIMLKCGIGYLIKWRKTAFEIV